MSDQTSTYCRICEAYHVATEPCFHLRVSVDDKLRVVLGERDLARKESAALAQRLAAINGQRNVMANSVNGQLWEAYWQADTEIGRLIGGDYDHSFAMQFEQMRIAQRESAALALLLEQAKLEIAELTKENQELKAKLC